MANTPNEDRDLSQKHDGEETTETGEEKPQGQEPDPGTPPAPGDESQDEEQSKAGETQVASLIARKDHWKNKAKTWEERAKAAGWKPDNQPGEVKNPPNEAPLTPPIAATIPTTDEELTAQFPSFPYLSTQEQNQLRGMVAVGKTVAQVNELLPALNRFRESEHFSESFESLINDETYEALIEHRDAFKAFCLLPENKGVNIKLVADSFMFRRNLAESAIKREAEEARDSERQARTGVLPTQGGPKAEAKRPEFTEQELEAIRTSDPKKYRELLKKGIK